MARTFSGGGRMTKKLKQEAEDFFKRYFKISNDEFEKAKETDEGVNNECNKNAC